MVQSDRSQARQTMRVVYLLAVGFVSWLATFLFRCYYQSLPGVPSAHPREHEPPYPGATDDHLFWFLQISDIHLSLVNNFKVREDLHSFCTKTVSTVNPALILVTGDLTHAKLRGRYRSRQFEEEWKVYGEIMATTGVRDRQPWLDIRGNHDNYDIKSRSHPSNLYLKYSSGFHKGSLRNTHSYSYTHTTTFGSYQFIAMDACPSPGPRRPFNFFGILHYEDLSALQYLVHSSENHSSFSPPNATIWFSHYPTATIATDHTALRRLMSSAVAHVCGHLHDPLGGVPMYSRHPSGHLELELIDFKDNRGYRLMAMDHDLFSFMDNSLDRWPLVLITNPKDSHFSVPGKEPLGRIRQSTHIRILAFSPYGIKSVQVWVDGYPLLPATRVNRGPLYTTPWDPSLFSSGLHTVTVVAYDERQNVQNISHQFSLDGHHLPPLKRLPQLLLLTDFSSLFQMLFIFLWLSLLTFLVHSWLNRTQAVFLQPLVRKKPVFLPLILLVFYLGVGPWFFGEIITGAYGLVFVHGILVSGQFIPGSLTYFFGIQQILLWYIPLTFYLNHLLSSPCSFSSSCLRQLLCYFIMFCLFLNHCQWLLTFSPYGPWALILSPGISWTLFLSLYLFLRSWKGSSKVQTLCMKGLH